MSQLALETITFNAEQTVDPATPAANKAVLYTKDDGTGKTQLTVKFANTVIETVATRDSVQTFTKAQRGAIVVIPATTGSVTLDFSLSNNWNGTLTGNITLANPTNLVAGQSGIIAITNGATPYTIAYGSYFKGPSGVLPALTGDANAKDTLAYYVDSTTQITITSLGDIR